MPHTPTHTFPHRVQVQAKVAGTAFHLPQVAQESSAFFCNESVYGRLNLLRVSGVVRVDEEAMDRASGGRAAAAVAAVADADAAAATARRSTVDSWSPGLGEDD